MDSESQRELRILTTIAEGAPVTQRALAERLGIALGLANLYVKRLARKGYIKVTTIPPNRLKYLITPRGLAQKTRLTYEYMRYSLRLYGQARQNLREALSPLAQQGVRRIALYGTGEAAELAYLTLKELGLEPIAVFDERPQAGFLGVSVRPSHELTAGMYERIVLATFEDASRLVAELTRLGVPREKLICLRQPHTRSSEPKPGDARWSGWTPGSRASG